MEENKQSDNSNEEKKAAIEITETTPKKVVPARKPVVRKPLVKTAAKTVSNIDETPSESRNLNGANPDKTANLSVGNTEKLDKKNLKKLKKMSDKLKEKEKKAKEKLKEKE